MDSIRVSEAPDPSSILGEATNFNTGSLLDCVRQAGIPVEATNKAAYHAAFIFGV